MPEVAVLEQRRERVHVHRAAVHEPEAARVVHPGVDGDHHQRAGEARDDDRDPGQDVRARRQAIPAVDVDPDEDRLDEERDALDREAESEHVSERRHEVRPEHAQLEAEDRPGHDADGEQREHHLRPAPREHAIGLVAGAHVQPLREDDERRERDSEADERDVHDERQRLELARLEEVVLIGRSEGGRRTTDRLRQQGVRHGAALGSAISTCARHSTPARQSRTRQCPGSLGSRA